MSKVQDTPKTHTPELTLKAIVISIVLIVLLVASNVYLGLKAGATVATSIPAIIIALAILRMFKKHSILEINIVQTGASIGEGAVSGLIFTIPALIIMHYWTSFNYWDICIITFFGSTLGILFAIPLRRALLKDKDLQFPEGTAIGHVIKAVSKEKDDIKPIAKGGIAGSALVLLASGFRLLSSSYSYWMTSSKMIFGFGIEFSPALLAAGYICGINLAVGMTAGIAAAWLIIAPIVSSHLSFAHHLTSPENVATYVWQNYIRYIGIGTMLTGGVWIIFALLKPIISAVKGSFQSLKMVKEDRSIKLPQNQRDIPINYVLWGLLIISGVIFAYLGNILFTHSLGFSSSGLIIALVICFIYVLIAGFIFSSVGGYFSGLVGASNSPCSGLIIASILILALIIMGLSGLLQFDHHISKIEALGNGALVIMICAFIGTASTAATELSQLSKVGDIVDATPWKQQVTLIGGALIAAFIIPAILTLLFNAYGIAGVFPHQGMPVSQMLPAPQAAMIAAIAQAVFSHQLPWNMLILGIVLGIVCIIIDEFLKRKYKKRLLVLAVGLGLYLPMAIAVPFALGGFISYFIQRTHVKRGEKIIDEHVHSNKGMHNALLLACGLVAGSTIMGVILAIPFALFKNSDILRIVPKSFETVAGPITVVVFAALCLWIYKVGTKRN